MVLDSSVCFWSVHCSAALGVHIFFSDFLQFGGGVIKCQRFEQIQF